MTPATLTASSACDDARIAQARRALQDANRTRVEKAHMKRDFRDGALTLAEIAAQRPAPLRPMPLFALLLELPGFGRHRLDKLNRRAIADGINLARTLGDASASTLDWLVRAADGQTDDDTTSDPATVTPVVERELPAQDSAAALVDQDQPAPGAPRRLLHGVVGSYRASSGQRRRLILDAADGETPVLLDRGGDDERVVERFAATAGLLEVAAVAGGYLTEARRLGRPVVAAGNPTASQVAFEEQNQ